MSKEISCRHRLPSSRAGLRCRENKHVTVGKVDPGGDQTGILVVSGIIRLGNLLACKLALLEDGNRCHFKVYPHSISREAIERANDGAILALGMRWRYARFNS